MWSDCLVLATDVNGFCKQSQALPFFTASIDLICRSSRMDRAKDNAHRQVGREQHPVRGFANVLIRSAKAK